MPNPTEVHDPRSGGWVAVLPAATTTAILQDGYDTLAGVLLDAFVVRMLLIPAVMHLLGEKAWWLPKWLDRILPDVDVEGAALERTHPVHGAVAVAEAEGGEAPEAPAGELVDARE